jgi:hypothetical protein
MTRPPPNQHAALYLSRSGYTALLDIDISMLSRYWKEVKIGTNDWANQATYIPKLLEFLAFHGASTSRLKSLSIQSHQPEPLFKFIDILNAESAPALQCLSLEWRPYENLMDSIENARTRDIHNLPSDLRSLSGLSLPNLHCVKLLSIPWGFVLDRPSPLLTGLTSLELTSATYLTTYSKLHELLSANPQLESLVINSRAGNSLTTDIASHTVQLSSLRNLSIQGGCYIEWVQDVLKMIEAPSLAKFTLSSLASFDERIVNLLRFISKPLYPALHELDISDIGDGSSEVADMCSSFPSITRLSISYAQAKILCRVPWVLPQLNFISFKYVDRVKSHLDLGDILRRRADAGFPIQVVELLGISSRIRREGLQLSGTTVIVKDQVLGSIGF